MSSVDRGYTNILAVLRSRPTSIPFNALVAGISHFLAHSPSTQPSPAPLAETVIQSPIWQSHSLKQYIDLGNAFGQALLTKRKELSEEKRGLFSASLSFSLQQWINSILEGVKSGGPLARLDIYRGLLLGIDSLEDADKLLGRRTRERIEKSAVLAFAEMIDQSREEANKVWLREFKPRAESPEDVRNLAIILAAQYFTKLSASVLSALDVPSLVFILLLTVSSTFMNGWFLKDADQSIHKDDSGEIIIEKSSALTANLSHMKSSDTYNNVPSICRLLAHVISTLVSVDSASRRRRAWEVLEQVVDALDQIATTVEAQWKDCPLSTVKEDEHISADSHDIAADVWKHLKTLVFAIVVIQLPVLKVLLYLRPLPREVINAHKGGRDLDAATLCIQIIQTLSRLSFVVMQLGGVSAMPPQTTNPDEYQFKELKQVFFMAMDVVAAHPEKAENFVKEIAMSCGPADGTPLQQAKRAFALSCVEQLVPCLSEKCILECVLPLCEPHLHEYSERATYESAHSVILSIFATHAKLSAEQHGATPKDSESPSLAERLVPGYVKCLLENVTEGRLTTTQFRLAYSALVRSAGARTSSYIRTQSKPDHDAAPTYGPPTPSPPSTALAKLCISSLITASQSPSLDPSEGFRLHFTLASLISDVSLDLLPYLLHEVEQMIDNEDDPARRKALIDAVYEEMMEKVGDREKDAVMRWWLEGVRRWRSSARQINVNTADNAVLESPSN